MFTPSVLRYAFVLLLVVGFGARAQPSVSALGTRDVAFVAATPHFRFHSDF